MSSSMKYNVIHFLIIDWIPYLSFLLVTCIQNSQLFLEADRLPEFWVLAQVIWFYDPDPLSNWCQNLLTWLIRLLKYIRENEQTKLVKRGIIADLFKSVSLLKLLNHVFFFFFFFFWFVLPSSRVIQVAAVPYLFLTFWRFRKEQNHPYIN